MPDESLLRADAREVVRTGKMPSRRRDRPWGGLGVGGDNVMARPRPEKKREQRRHQDPPDGASGRRSSLGRDRQLGSHRPAVQHRRKDTRARPEDRPARPLGDTKLDAVKRISVKRATAEEDKR